MRETIKSIIDWSVETFPDATLRGQLDKFKEEKREWIDSGYQDITELADMLIVACSLSRFNSIEAMFCFETVANELYHSGFSTMELEKAVDAKMAVNIERKWNKLNGQYRHKE